MKIAIVAATIVALASPAVAGFVENRAGWNRLGEQRKMDYAMGLIDAITTGDTTSPYGMANAIGVFNCLHALSLTSSSIATIIDEGYTRAPTLWGEMPILILQRELDQICRVQINEERKERGLQMLPAATE